MMHIVWIVLSQEYGRKQNLIQPLTLEADVTYSRRESETSPGCLNLSGTSREALDSSDLANHTRSETRLWYEGVLSGTLRLVSLEFSTQLLVSALLRLFPREP
jgi:hypothetical protein